MNLFLSNRHTVKSGRAICAALLIAAAALQPAFAEPKSFVANKTPARQELDSKEADLLKRESDLLKQLSADSRTRPASEETHARLEPSRQPQAAPKVEANSAETKSDIVNNPLAAEQEAVIAEKDRQIETLSQEVSKLRNRLMLAETEVERLSSIIDERNKRQLSAYPSSAAQSLFNKKIASSPNAAAVNNRMPPPSDPQDMQVVTVRADKAFLRTGPGEENSPLMTVSRGTRLAVETRSGDWYRIISPAGTRAWVAANVVVFGDTDPARASRNGGSGY